MIDPVLEPLVLSIGPALELPVLPSDPVPSATAARRDYVLAGSHHSGTRSPGGSGAGCGIGAEL